MELSVVVTLIITVIGWAVMVGVCKQKIETNEKNQQEIKTDYSKKLEEVKTDFSNKLGEIKTDFSKDIDDLKKRQDKTDVAFNAIQNQLSEILAQQSYIKGKVDMMVDGKGK